jgi:hypothetical protein
MAELKTQKTSASAHDFINLIEDETKKQDCLRLLELFKESTGEEPVIWGSSIVGYGIYHYKSEKSRQEGDWLLVGFSPRKQNLTLYIMHGNQDSLALLEKLGKHKTSGGMGGCLYINKLADIDQPTLATLIKKSYQYMKKTNNIQ